jgi:hypothetical protein
VCTAKLNTRNHPFCPKAVLLYPMRGAQTWREEDFPVVSGSKADMGVSSLAHPVPATQRVEMPIGVQHARLSVHHGPAAPLRRTFTLIDATRVLMGPHICVLTFLLLLQEFTMDIGSFPLFVSYLDSPHPFGSCSRLVPDGCALDSLNRIPPGVRSEQGPKPLACATSRRPHGQSTMRSSRVLGKEAPAGPQT